MHGAHGEWCNAKTYPTTCPNCDAGVFYFSCDHGSGIFLEELGAPWQKHKCGAGPDATLEKAAFRVELGSQDHSVVNSAARRIIRGVKKAGGHASGPITLPNREKDGRRMHMRLVDIHGVEAATVARLPELQSLPPSVQITVSQ